MSLAGLLVRDVSIVRAATTTDRYQNAASNWSSVTVTAAKGWLAQVSSDEPAADGRTPSVSEWTLFLAADSDVTEADRVMVDGTTYEIVGGPNRAHTPRGEHHVECRLRKVEG